MCASLSVHPHCSGYGLRSPNLEQPPQIAAEIYKKTGRVCICMRLANRLSRECLSISQLSTCAGEKWQEQRPAPCASLAPAATDVPSSLVPCHDSVHKICFLLQTPTRNLCIYVTPQASPWNPTAVWGDAQNLVVEVLGFYRRRADIWNHPEFLKRLKARHTVEAEKLKYDRPAQSKRRVDCTPCRIIVFGFIPEFRVLEAAGSLQSCRYAIHNRIH